MSAGSVVTGSAVIDATGRYRYVLRRQWRHPRREPLVLGASGVLWIMLNPSTADAQVDDPTIRRCIAFSRLWGYDDLTVVNLFALRATDPKALNPRPDLYQSEHLAILGPENDPYIAAEAFHATLIVAAWGNHRSLHGRDEEVRELIDRPLHHLGLTKMGQPRHPLYVPSDIKPQPWKTVAGVSA